MVSEILKSDLAEAHGYNIKTSIPKWKLVKININNICNNSFK